MTDNKGTNIKNGDNLSTYTGSKLQSYNFSIGTGFGKLRNVTPVVSAIRFQERLKQLNLIKADLPDNVIENLARQFSRRVYYFQVHNRAEKYFWKDIENTLTNNGISLDGLNMFADAYLRESINELRFLREEGFMTGLNFQFNYQNMYNAFRNDKHLQEQFYTFANIYFNYSHQLNLNSEIFAKVSFTGGPNVLKNPSVKQQYYFTSEIGYNYELTDRLVAAFDESFSLTFQNSSVQQKILSNQLSLSLNYFIEDNLSFNAFYTWYYIRYKDYILVFPESSNQHQISAGFTYYFNRAIMI